MSWLLPTRSRPEDRERLDALVAESLTERERAVEVATAVKLQTSADQQRVRATIGDIRDRIAKQQARAADRAATDSNIRLVADALKVVESPR